MAQSDMVQSVLKSLDILHLAAEAPNGMRLNEIAEALDLKKTTVHNLIRTLRARGFLEKDHVNRFSLGPAVPELLRMSRMNTILTLAGIHLRHLAAEFPDGTLTFSEITANGIFCRLRISPDRHGELQRPLDRQFPPYVSASAVCLQAFGSNASALERNYPFSEYGAGCWKDREMFLSTLRNVRKDGYFRNTETEELTIAVPVTDNYAIGLRMDKFKQEQLENIITTLKESADNVRKEQKQNI